MSHYDPDDMESMHLRRTIYGLRKKLWLLVKKPGFLRLIHTTAPCDYHELSKSDFNFIQVSSLYNIFYYRIILVIGNRFSPQRVILEEVMYERGQSKESGFMWVLHLDPNCISLLKIYYRSTTLWLLIKIRIYQKKNV
jgi:hypothetical protein